MGEHGWLSVHVLTDEENAAMDLEHEHRLAESVAAARELIPTLSPEALQDVRDNRFGDSRWPQSFAGPPFYGYRGLRRAVLTVLEESDGTQAKGE